MCIGVHKEKVKLKEVIRIESLCTILTKKRGYKLLRDNESQGAGTKVLYLLGLHKLMLVSVLRLQ